VTGVALLVIAKEPIAGRAKTRLCPPCTPEGAARLAAAALGDTLRTVTRTPAVRRVLVFEGDARRWTPNGFDHIAQRGAGLAERLAAAFADAGQAALLVGMDTPQLTPGLLLDGLAALTRPDVDAVLGPATDGGYWSVGLKDPACAELVFAGIPMSEPTTYSHQRQRLDELGLRVHEQPALTDVDSFDDAQAVATLAPRTLFARVLAREQPRPVAA
jgi:uncharacterized protein